jgi:hypothetical protein
VTKNHVQDPGTGGSGSGGSTDSSGAGGNAGSGSGGSTQIHSPNTVAAKAFAVAHVIIILLKILYISYILCYDVPQCLQNIYWFKIKN